MTKNEILSRVDHTTLGACATWAEVSRLCEEAIRYKTASVCIPPSYVERVAGQYGESLTICTVIGFPLGYQTTACKVAETENAVKNGADEVDMVVNLGDVKNGDYAKVIGEIAAVKAAAGGKLLKVIVETCYLTEEEKIQLCKCVTDGGAHYIKTSTGFGTGGASLGDVELFKRHIGAGVKIKASGGIRTAEEMERYVAAGCDRIGTSSAVKALA